LNGFNGELQIEFEVDGIVWEYYQSVSLCCCEGFDSVQCDSNSPIGTIVTNENGLSSYMQNIYLPTVWGEMQGTAYNEYESPEKIDSWMILRSFVFGGSEDFRLLFTLIPINLDGTYGPVPIPVGLNDMDILTESRELFIPKKDQLVSADIGPGAKGTVTGTIYDDSGLTMTGIKVELNNGSAFSLTDDNGQYTFTDVPVGYVHIRAVISPTQDLYNVGILNMNGETITIDINGTGCNVTGTLYDWMNQPLPFTDVTLNVHWGSGLQQNLSTQTDINGIFTFSEVHNGSVNIWANSYNGAIETDEFGDIWGIGVSQTCPGVLNMDLSLIPNPYATSK